MPRPTKYSDDLAARICVHLSYGAPLEHAARAEGVSADSLRRWMARYPDFCAAVTRAQGQAVTQNLQRLCAAAERGSVSAAIWLLERLAPDAFARPQEVRHTGPAGGALEVRHTYEPERPAHVFDILREAGIVALGAAAAGSADDTAP